MQLTGTHCSVDLRHRSTHGWENPGFFRTSFPDMVQRSLHQLTGCQHILKRLGLGPPPPRAAIAKVAFYPIPNPGSMPNTGLALMQSGSTTVTLGYGGLLKSRW